MQCQLPAPFQLRGASRRRSCSGCSPPRLSDRWVGERESASNVRSFWRHQTEKSCGSLCKGPVSRCTLCCCPVTCQFGAQNGSKGNYTARSSGFKSYLANNLFESTWAFEKIHVTYLSQVQYKFFATMHLCDRSRKRWNAAPFGLSASVW